GQREGLGSLELDLRNVQTRRPGASAAFAILDHDSGAIGREPRERDSGSPCFAVRLRPDNRYHATDVIERRPARFAAQHVEKVKRIEIDLLLHGFERRDDLVVDIQLVAWLTEREIDGE